MSQITLPIAESFHSIQGEGTHCGTSMHFIRLAGCNVGKHPSQAEWEMGNKDFPLLKTGRVAYVCHTYDGRPFYCDTDFQKGEQTLLTDLFEQTWERHICLTGGEPLLHADKFEAIQALAHEKFIEIHLETSGTLVGYVPYPWWVTVSPKLGARDDMIKHASEIKLLIDKDFKLADVPFSVKEHDNVFIQPINSELRIDMDNFRLCQEVLRARPDWKLSIQLHKFLNVR